MKTEYRVITISALTGLLYWVADAFIDHLFFYEGTFVGSLLFDVPPYELYTRSTVLVIVLGFSLHVFFSLSRRRKAETTLKETRDYLNNIIESSLDCIVAVDNEGCILQTNKYLPELLGLKMEEVIGEHLSKFTPTEEGVYESTTGEQVEINKEFLNELQNLASRFAEEGKAYNVFGYLLSRNQKVTPVEQNIARLYNKEGKQLGAVGVIRDITERKKAEAELATTKENLGNLIEGSIDAIILSDSMGYLTRVNKSFEKLTGYEEKEVTGKHISEFTPYEAGVYESTTGEMVEIKEEFIANAMELAGNTLFAEEKISNWESYYLRKDGKIVPIESTVAYVFNNQGEKIAVSGICRDITERRTIERDIKNSRDFLESVIEGSRDGIAIVDKKGTIASANSALAKMCRFTKKELVGQHAAVLAIDDKDIRAAIIEKTAELLQRGHVFYESKQETKDGTIIDVECNDSLIKDATGNDIAGVSIIRDITDRKAMQHTLLQSEKLRSLGELAGGVAHDFNNVLAAILGRVQLLKMKTKMNLEKIPGKQERRKLASDLNKSLDIIEKASLDGAETVRRIQEFSRRRDEDKYLTAVDINEVIENALDYVKVRWKDEAQAKGIKFNITKVLSPLPPVAGNASELREVFTNLINNAIDAMPKGGKIKIKNFRDNNHISITLEDTGTGIPEAVQDRVFDPFFTTKGVQSTGLGMSVSYGIINRHRGTIAVKSLEGKGTTLTVTLLISEKKGEERLEEPLPEQTRKARVLIIEDEKEIRDILSDILTDGGHEVEAATDGTNGIKKFKNKEFDLVFTDLGMPKMSGWQVAEKIKSINKKVPVALITGWNIAVEVSDLKKSGVDLILKKPFKISQVIRLVQEGMILKDKFNAE